MKINQFRNNIRLAICVPCRDQVQSVFTFQLVKLIQHCNQIKLPVNLFMHSGSLISKQRQDLAKDAIETGATHILWLDSDMSFPSTVAETMLSHNTDIVACNYSTRTVPFKGVAYTKMGDWDSWLTSDNTSPRLQEVAGVGMGCMLTKTTVFENLELPWFEVSWVDEYNTFIGEDFYFCVCAKDAGYKIIVDTVLSNEIKHIGLNAFDLSKFNN